MERVQLYKTKEEEMERREGKHPIPHVLVHLYVCLGEGVSVVTLPTWLELPVFCL